MSASQKKTILISIAFLVVLALAALAYSYFIEPQRLLINAAELKVAKWNPAFDGLKIVAISDIHGGSNGVDEVKIRRLVDVANSQEPDLIVLLGDYVSQSGPRGADGKRALRMPVETIAANLRGLRSMLGVFAVLGNHDGWHDDREIAAAFNGIGIRVLEGEVAVVEKNGAKLRILGLPDHLKIKSWEAFNDNARKVLAATEGSDDILVLEQQSRCRADHQRARTHLKRPPIDDRGTYAWRTGVASGIWQADRAVGVWSEVCGGSCA